MSLKPDEFNIEFMRENDFIRKQCKVCNSFFWTQNHEQDLCMESPCTENEFIGNSPAKIKTDLNKMRKIFLKHFEENSHVIIKPYPIVARWREDLLVTIASIVDFQPYVTNGEMAPPANPLVVSQPCLRFEDIDNVGLTFGRHLTIFEMGGAHAFNYPNSFTYWKNETLRYHHELLTNKLGVPSEKVTYKEHFWSGGGNAGPDVEPNVMGLEISTLVFMCYRVENNKLYPIPVKTVDTGYGIERWAWLTMGTPSAFHVIFGKMLDKVFDLLNIKINSNVLIEAGKLSGGFKASDPNGLRKNLNLLSERLDTSIHEIESVIKPFENATTILDHTKALIFMLAEGVVPSNVKAGYLARMLARRSYRLLSSFQSEDKFFDILEKQIDYWSNQFPHIKYARNEIMKLAEVEIDKYTDTLKRESEKAKKKLTDLKSKGNSTIPLNILQEFYESHGLHPQQISEISKDVGIQVEIPLDFFSTLVKNKSVQDIVKIEQKGLDIIKDLPETEALYYKDMKLFEFTGRVLFADKNFVILDKTAFYPEGGGQPGDCGLIKYDNIEIIVKDTIKVNSIIIHKTKGDVPPKGTEIKGIINADRRRALMVHHTATHILNGATRHILGEHIWQAGAQKDVDKSRLDITHYAHLTRDEIYKIEDEANRIIRLNLPIEIVSLQRDEAERNYGFRLYQGGVVPGKEIRIVKIGNWDVEACGGIHCSRSGEIGLIKILKVERIQDGVERIEFVGGETAIKFIQNQEDVILKIAEIVNSPRDKIIDALNKFMMEYGDLIKKQKTLLKKLSESYEIKVLEEAKEIEGLKVYFEIDSNLNEEFHIMVGERVIEHEPLLIYCALVLETKVAKVIVLCGKKVQDMGVWARDIVLEISKKIGGGGGGDRRFGRGGGNILNQVEDIEHVLYSSIKNFVKVRKSQ